MIRNWKRKVSMILAAAMLATIVPVALPAQAEAAVSSKKAVKAVKKAPTISSIANLTKTVELNAKVSMPATVTAVMSDKTKKAVTVKWDKVLNAQVEGTYTASGTVAGFAKKVAFKLVVKAPKMGTIDIPKVTDSTLKKPTDVKLGIGKDSFYKGSDWITVDKTMPSVFWTQNATEADCYIVRMYDQYNQKKVDTYHGIGQNDMTKPGYYDIRLEETVNIRTITITPINSVDGITGGGDKSNDKVGETAVFECSVEITQKAGKAVKVKATPLSYDPDQLMFTYPEKTTSYAEYYLHTEYTITDKNGKQNKSSGKGSNAEKDGSIIIYVDAAEYKVKYNNPTAKASLSTYSNATVTDDTKASFVINVSPITCK